MANIVITVAGVNSIVVDFGVYTASPLVDALVESFDNRDIVEVQLAKDSSHVTVLMRDAHGRTMWDVTWDSAYAGTEYFIIDKVATVAPTSQRDLFDKITALRG